MSQSHIPQPLEVECLALDPKLQAVQSAYGIWEELGKEGGGVWEGDGEDDARREKKAAEHGMRLYWTGSATRRECWTLNSLSKSLPHN